MVDTLEDKFFSRVRPFLFRDKKIDINSGTGIKNTIDWDNYISTLGHLDQKNIDKLIQGIFVDGKSDSILYAVGSSVKKSIGMKLDHEPEDIDLKISVGEGGDIEETINQITKKAKSLVEFGHFRTVVPYKERGIDGGLRNTLILFPYEGKNIQIILPRENKDEEDSAQIDLSSNRNKRPIAYFGRL